MLLSILELSIIITFMTANFDVQAPKEWFTHDEENGFPREILV